MSTDRPEPPPTGTPGPDLGSTATPVPPGCPHGWPAPPYPPGAYPGWAYPSSAPSTDMTAVLGLVFAFVFAPAGLVLSIIGMRRTKNTPDRTGYTLALVGMILSAVQTALVALVLLAWAGMAASFLTTGLGSY